MNKKLAAFAAIPVLGISVFGASAASAHGFFSSNISPDDLAARQQERFQQQATILGISVDDVKAAWAEGKTMRDIIKEKGLSQSDIDARMKSAAQAKMKINLQTLVDKGIITQAQADARLAAMKDRAVHAPAKGMMGKGRGMHGGFFGM